MLWDVVTEKIEQFQNIPPKSNDKATTNIYDTFFLPYQSKYHYEMAFSLQNMLNNKHNRKMKMHKRKKMTSFIIIP